MTIQPLILLANGGLLVGTLDVHIVAFEATDIRNQNGN